MPEQRFHQSEADGKGTLFFSEEKNQKTFASALADRYRTWPVSIRSMHQGLETTDERR
jgi:hypothetical protein